MGVTARQTAQDDGRDWSELDDVADDLRWAAQQQIDNFYRQAGDDNTHKYPTLARIVETIAGPEAWRENPSRCLEQVIREAIDRLPKELSGLRRDAPLGKGKPQPWKGAPERLMAEYLYALRKDTVDPRQGERHAPTKDDPEATQAFPLPRSYTKDYRPAAFRAAGLDEAGKNLTKDEKDKVVGIIRHDLAAVLLAMEQKAIKDRDQAEADAVREQAALVLAHQRPTVVRAGQRLFAPLTWKGGIEPQWPDWYVSRPRHERSLWKRLQDGEKVFLLYGTMGTGKTTLAQEVALAYLQAGSAEGLPRVDGSSRQALWQSTGNVLRRCQAEVPAHPFLWPDAFKELLESDQAPPMVLLDNMQTAEAVAELLPSHRRLRSAVIITSRRQLRIPAAKAYALGELTSAEGTALVRSLLDEGVSEEDAALLAQALGNHPQAIVQACGYITVRSCSVGEFRALLEQDIATVLDRVPDDPFAPSLTAVCRVAIQNLDPDALRLLDLIACFGGVPLSRGFLWTLWTGADLFPLAPPAESHHGLDFHKALRVLEHCCLVKVRRFKGPEEPDELVRTTTLTIGLVLSLRPDTWQATRKNLLAAVEQADFLGRWPAGKTLPIWLANRWLDGWRLLIILAELGGDDDRAPHLADLAAFVVRARSQDHPFPTSDLAPARNVLETDADLLHDYWDGKPPAELGPSRAAELDADPDYQRRWHGFRSLLDELLHFRSLFPADEPAALDELLQKVPDHENLSKTFRLLSGMEEPPGPADAPVYGGTIADLRGNADEARQHGHLFAAGGWYFMLGSHHFNASDYASALDCYQQAHDTWSVDPRYLAGERCKAAVRAADACARLGHYDDATAWRTRAVSGVKAHIERHRLREWTADYAANAALFRALCEQTPAIPSDETAPAEQTEGTAHTTDVAEAAEPVGPYSRYEEAFGEAGIDLSTLAEDADASVFVSDTSLALVRSVQGDMEPGFVEHLGEMIQATPLSPIDKVKLSLLEAKLAMHCTETGHGQVIAAETVQRVTDQVQYCRDHHLPYWHADALLTAYVLCTRYGCGTQEQADQLLPELQDALNGIGRSDRLQIALAAADKDRAFNALWLLAE